MDWVQMSIEQVGGGQCWLVKEEGQRLRYSLCPGDNT